MNCGTTIKKFGKCTLGVPGKEKMEGERTQGEKQKQKNSKT